eukprot:TRINITY_DN10306_c0_g1_i1.p1 TRINITY_DN10306_c0_g1~~TRINITY_DN10306_c0_g1_i1.p1  ORF type:complete len:184 (+),score=9.47 TRINITY_DN10306_c0_g1_i1:61-552(+)
MSINSRKDDFLPTSGMQSRGTEGYQLLPSEDDLNDAAPALPKDAERIVNETEAARQLSLSSRSTTLIAATLAAALMLAVNRRTILKPQPVPTTSKGASSLAYGLPSSGIVHFAPNCGKAKDLPVLSSNELREMVRFCRGNCSQGHTKERDDLGYHYPNIRWFS